MFNKHDLEIENTKISIFTTDKPVPAFKQKFLIKGIVAKT
jgi:hypothetical protein